MRRLGRFLGLCLNAVLLSCLLGQILVLGCLLTYGHIPLPVNWVEKTTPHWLPAGVTLSAEAYTLQANGTFRIESPSLRLTQFEQPVFEAEQAQLRPTPFSRDDKGSGWGQLLLSGGSAFLPAVYSPSGQRTALIDRITANCSIYADRIDLESFAATHNNIRVRGGAVIPLQSGSGEKSIIDEPMERERALRRIFSQSRRLIEEASRIEGLREPTLLFHLRPDSEERLVLSSRLTSRRLDRSNLQGRDLSLQTTLTLTSDQPVANSSVLLQAAEIRSEAMGWAGQSVRALVEQEAWQDILNGDWPDLYLAASAVQFQSIELKHPQLKLRLRDLPEVTFEGTSRGLKGAARVAGRVHLTRQSGAVEATGSVDLRELAGIRFLKRIPEMTFSKPPYYDLKAEFEEGFRLKTARLRTQVDDVTVGGIHFDHIRGEGTYDDGWIDLPKIYLRRGWQWLDLGFAFHPANLDYRIRLCGSAKPDDYNAVLPRWWEAIFKDFDFENAIHTRGDFVIYGNAGKRAADLFFGHVRARQVGYKEVRVERGELYVRGRGPYTEIYGMDLQQTRGWTRGSIRFSSRLDDIRSPASVRLDLQTRLSLEDAAKLFNPGIAAILGDFKTDEPVEAGIRGAIFNSAYPEFSGLSHIDVGIDCPRPIRYKDLPLDHLGFQLYGRKTISSLRDLSIGLAGGEVRAAADILTPHNAPAEVRIKGELTGARQDRVDKLLSELLGESKPAKPAGGPKQLGRLDLALHARGPTAGLHGFQGYGRFHLRNEKLAAIQLLGPFSKILEQARLGYTTFGLNQMYGVFELNNSDVRFEPLRIDGPRARIEAPGRLNIFDQSLDMRVSVDLFGNTGNPDSGLRRIGDLITRPIPNLLQFELTGTLEKQNWRSVYDPRNLLRRL